MTTHYCSTWTERPSSSNLAWINCLSQYWLTSWLSTADSAKASSLTAPLSHGKGSTAHSLSPKTPKTGERKMCRCVYASLWPSLIYGSLDYLLFSPPCLMKGVYAWHSFQAGTGPKFSGASLTEEEAKAFAPCPAKSTRAQELYSLIVIDATCWLSQGLARCRDLTPELFWYMVWGGGGEVS